MAVSTVGSLTAWLTQRISIHEGWGKDGIRITATGGGPAMVSAIVSGAVDAGMGSYETALKLAEEHRGAPARHDGQIRAALHHPCDLRPGAAASTAIPPKSGLSSKSFFAVLDYMRAHRDKTIEIADDVIHDGKNVVAGAYDREMPLMSKDGTFDPGRAQDHQAILGRSEDLADDARR